MGGPDGSASVQVARHRCHLCTLNGPVNKKEASQKQDLIRNGGKKITGGKQQKAQSKVVAS